MEDKSKNRNQIDITLGDLLKSIPLKFPVVISGKPAKNRLDTVIKYAKERRVDLLLELEDGSILHIEVQTFNDENMPRRMLEYYMLISSVYENKEIIQKVLYIGYEPLKMSDKIDNQNIKFKYDLIDMRSISSNDLIDSPDIKDVVLASLCNIENPEKYKMVLKERMRKLPEPEIRDYTSMLLTISSLRPNIRDRIVELIKEVDMPITITKEMMDETIEELIKEVPSYKETWKRGLQEGLQEAKKEAIVKLYTKKCFSLSEIADTLDIPIEFVENTLKEEGLLKE